MLLWLLNCSQITNGENTKKFLKLAEGFGGDVAEQVSVISLSNASNSCSISYVVMICYK